MNSESKGMLLGIFGVIAFGLTLPITRFVVPYFNPIFIGLGRAVLATFFAVSLLIITKQSIPNKSQCYKLFIVALGVVVGFPVLSAWAMQTLPSSHGGVVLGILPLATAIVAVFISNERPSLGFWIFSIIGSALVIIYSLLHGSGSFQVGDFALLGAIVSAAVGYAVGGQISKELGGWQVICWTLVISFPFIFLPAWILAPNNWLEIPFDIWVGFLYLALVSQLFGFFLWYKGLALGGIARVSQAQLIQPFITIIASVLLFNEKLEIITIAFALLVISTVAIGKRMPVNKKV